MPNRLNESYTVGISNPECPKHENVNSPIRFPYIPFDVSPEYLEIIQDDNLYFNTRRRFFW